MLDRTVEDPSGAAWSVGIRTRPRWRALSRRFGAWRRRQDLDADIDPFAVDLGDGPIPARSGGDSDVVVGDVPGDVDAGGGWLDDFGDDLLIGALVAVALFLGVVLAWWVLIPLLLLVVDAVVVVLLFVVGLLARIAVGRPWVVRARQLRSGGQWYEVDRKGWRNARELQSDWESAIARGQFRVTPAA